VGGVRRQESFIGLGEVKEKKKETSIRKKYFKR